MLKSMINPDLSGKKIMFVFVVIVLCNQLYGEYIIQREQAKLRQGPGSFYLVVDILAKGTRINAIPSETGWLSMNHKENTVYLSENAVKLNQLKRSLFDKMAHQKTEINISKMGMSAGVKGFAGKFNERIKGDPKSLDFMFKYHIDHEKFQEFKKGTQRKIKIKKIRRQYIIPESQIDYYTFSEEGLGLAIASKIAQNGLIKDIELTNYINYVGNILVEASDAYDTEFKFFILPQNSINAYSCPGGIVFITSGLFHKLYSEAELAFVLSHEIAHVSRKHGMKEAENRKEHILADDLFVELDNELEEIGKGEISETELELEELTVSIYDTIYQGRLADYEEEADELGLIYMIRAGYDQNAALDLLQRLASQNIKSGNEHYTNEQIHKRLLRIENKIVERNKNIKLLTNKKRFMEKSSNLKIKK